MTTATWSLTTPQLTLGFVEHPDGDVRLTVLTTAGREWIAEPRPLFALAGDPRAAIGLRNVTAEETADGLVLRGALAPLGVQATIALTAHADDSVIVTEITLRNDTDAAIDVGSLTSLRFALPRSGVADRLSVLAGGRWDEAMPPRGYRLQTFDVGMLNRQWFGAADDGRSSGEYVPWFALHDATGGLFAGLVWSGRWRLDLRHDGETVALGIGISEFTHTLAPGAEIALPGMVLSGFAGDLDDGANAWRHWIATHWMPPTPENWPWIQYNHWYAYYGDIDAERLLGEATLAAEAGCEVFVIDDGWFRGRRAESYVRGWGDWTEDRGKFPLGLRAFGDELRAMGLKFGLWVEPERADDQGDLVRAHPDWVATRDGEPIVRQGHDGPEGVHLCLGNPAVQEWMIAELVRVVRGYGVDWLKWDDNMGYGLGCNAPDHGHQGGDGHAAHTLGLYRVLAELRRACPELMIENCASGGHRVDLGTLRHTHTNWVSDYTHRAASVRQHVQGAGLVLPLAHLNAWVLEERDIAAFRSRMGGAFGVSSFLARWLPEERDRLRVMIAEYATIRPYLSGARYLLTGPWHQDWEVWQLVHPTEDSSVLLIFREGGAIDRIHVHPRAFTAVATTGVVREEAPLTDAGIAVTFPERGSAIVRLRGV